MKNAFIISDKIIPKRSELKERVTERQGSDMKQTIAPQHDIFTKIWILKNSIPNPDIHAPQLCQLFWAKIWLWDIDFFLFDEGFCCLLDFFFAILVLCHLTAMTLQDFYVLIQFSARISLFFMWKIGAMNIFAGYWNDLTNNHNRSDKLGFTYKINGSQLIFMGIRLLSYR